MKKIARECARVCLCVLAVRCQHKSSQPAIGGADAMLFFFNITSTRSLMNVEIYVFSNFLFKRKFSTVKHVAHCTAAQSRTNYSKIKGSEIFMPLSSFKPNPLIVLSRLFLFHHFFLPPFAHTHTHTHTLMVKLYFCSAPSRHLFLFPPVKKNKTTFRHRRRLPPSLHLLTDETKITGNYQRCATW